MSLLSLSFCNPPWKYAVIYLFIWHLFKLSSKGVCSITLRKLSTKSKVSRRLFFYMCFLPTILQLEAIKHVTVVQLTPGWFLDTVTHSYTLSAACTHTQNTPVRDGGPTGCGALLASGPQSRSVEEKQREEDAGKYNRESLLLIRNTGPAL